MTEKQLKSRREKELAGSTRAFKLFKEFLEKKIFCDDYEVTYGKVGNFPIKYNVRLFNSKQKYPNRPVYRFDVGYPNITNEACFQTLIELAYDYTEEMKFLFEKKGEKKND